MVQGQLGWETSDPEELGEVWGCPLPWERLNFGANPPSCGGEMFGEGGV